MKVSDFIFSHSDDPDMVDNEYRHKTDPRFHIQACVYGRYFIPVIREGDEFQFLPAQGSLKNAVAALSMEVSA